jgi:WD40 repeat protein
LGKVRAILLGHRSSVCAVCFAPDGRTLASGDVEGLVKLWEVGDSRVQERCGARIHDGYVWCLAFSPDGSLLASGSANGHLKLWDVATGRVSVIPDTQHDFTQGVSFSGDGRTLIAARETGIIQLWDVAERRRITTLRADSELDCVAFTSDGRFVAAGGADATVRVWDLAPSLAAGFGGESKHHVRDR